MRTNLTIKLPKLNDENEFESLLRDICEFEWNDTTTKKFGRKGQKQYGIDVYGHPDDKPSAYRGVQCKHRETDKQLTQKEIKKEVADARLFPHKLDKLIIATDAPRDSNTQILIDKINEEELKNGGFQVSIWFWDDITERLDAYPSLIIKYYRDLFKHITTYPLLERLNDVPIQILLDTPLYSQDLLDIVTNLRFRGVRCLVQNQPSLQYSQLASEFIDGVICGVIDDDIFTSETSLIYFLSNLKHHPSRLESDTPLFLICPQKHLSQFTESTNKLKLDLNRFTILLADQSAISISDQIFNIVFPHGYKRRGALNAFNILARTHEMQASGILLDINLQEKLSTEKFPTNDEWENQIIPSLRSIQHQILSQAESPRIQINSQLPIPAAIALGFYFNLRVAKVGVWTRTIASSDFKKQFWLSNARSDNITFEPEWLPQNNGNGNHAVIEISSYVPIHPAVHEFINSQNLMINKWGIINLRTDGKTQENIEESAAVAFANSIGQTVRLLNSQGITDIHLFARIPSALAVLIGQRLFACGRIHLYWFTNPSYKFAFELV